MKWGREFKWCIDAPFEGMRKCCSVKGKSPLFLQYTIGKLGEGRQICLFLCDALNVNALLEDYNKEPLIVV
ncbi:hypothetical protein HMPREF0322_00904 [Desulfitobacterium hafniense DP7]|uniref:Uncharacterized protein n=2 Tax=Desulfitobacterium hafniense TaxID=49338 RepID=A0A0W1JD23_DESHA|nr:hypothetical protein HMPREF0322_00904 [Desulfitobacterium hafniense DP7]KTE89577.1 hypothetical protein AT727_12140 [Desulfitobacterium hafniense]